MKQTPTSGQGLLGQVMGSECDGNENLEISMLQNAFQGLQRGLPEDR